MGKFSIGYSVGTLIWIAVVLAQTFVCLSPADWAAWFGAIGTIGTLIGTIWLSIRKDVQDRRAALRRAYAIIAGVQPALGRLVADLLREEASLNFDNLATADSMRTLASGITAIPTIYISSDDLGALSVLDGSDAFRLAHAVGLLADFQSYVNSEVARFSADVVMSGHRRDEWARRMEKPRKMFQAVHANFRRLATQHATEPSGQEVWGD